ncbi:MAG: DNA adenine methylase [Myxococcota bacterium]|nr:DNA adenine methylase [Myxococcota bacterium]
MNKRTLPKKYTTEGIRYTGSKREIVPKIIELIEKNCPDVQSILDGCAGTTRVSQAFRKQGYSVTANDLAHYTQTFGNCYLLNKKPPSYYTKWIDHLNQLKGVDGWFTQNYGGVVTENGKGNAIQPDGKKRPWQKHNTQKLDAILEEIPNLTEDLIEKSVLLTSTILALDKVDNTMGHQVAYLKDWPRRSYGTISLVVPQLIPRGSPCFVSQRSIFDVQQYHQLVYLDPPYGTNNQKTKTTRVRYWSYYHIWTTVCLNDKPKLHGASMRRYDASSDSIPNALSVFESTDYDVVYQATKRLIKQLNCRYVLFSYANKGKLPLKALREIFAEYKILQFLSFDHKENAMKHCIGNAEWLGDQKKNQEFLILIEKPGR